MITEKELELFEKKMQDNKHCLSQGNKILAEMIRQIKESTNSANHNIDNWSDYGAWDKD